MLAPASAEGGRPRRFAVPVARPARVTPADRAAAAREVAAGDLVGPLVCRRCALRAVEEMVLIAVELAERDLREKFREQMQWPN